MRLGSQLSLSGSGCYYIFGILLIGLVVGCIVYSLSEQQQKHQTLHEKESFANIDIASNGKCAAGCKDSYGCSPGQGEAWCERQGRCINRLDSGLVNEDAFNAACTSSSPMLGPGGTQQMLGPGGTQQMLGPGGTQQNPSVPDVTPVSPSNANKNPDDQTCCLSKAKTSKSDTSDKCVPPAPTPKKCDAPPRCECPKPVYCPPCPKCPATCPSMCPDLSKYVLKSSIPPCPESKVDPELYMLRSECKQPDLTKYMLKSSLPNFKCPTCPPCICKCDAVDNETVYKDNSLIRVVNTHKKDQPTPTPVPTQTPSPTPTPTSTFAPTYPPTQAPTYPPTQAPTYPPTQAPTCPPTTPPLQCPTPAPTQAPTPAPTPSPTPAPTPSPTPAPTPCPTVPPTIPPHTHMPSPTHTPTQRPTRRPTQPPKTRAPRSRRTPKPSQQTDVPIEEALGGSTKNRTQSTANFSSCDPVYTSYSKQKTSSARNSYFDKGAFGSGSGNGSTNSSGGVRSVGNLSDTHESANFEDSWKARKQGMNNAYTLQPVVSSA